MNTNQAPQVKMDFPPSLTTLVKEVLSGEYDIPFNIQPTVICDIGANVGSFAVWALHRWPGSTVHCFEPSSFSFEYLKKNLQPYNNVVLHNVAIGDPKRTKLYQGVDHCARASFFKLGEQTDEFELVTTVLPSSLPQNCDLLKIDTEGCEVEILEGLTSRQYIAIIIEYHSDDDRRKIDQLLKNYILVGSKVVMPNRGVLKYLSLSQLLRLKEQSQNK